MRHSRRTRILYYEGEIVNGAREQKKQSISAYIRSGLSFCEWQGIAGPDQAYIRVQEMQAREVVAPCILE